MIRLEHLHIDLPGFRLRDISLEVEEREFFVLMGPTGAGKTVLLEGIAGLVGVSSGRVLIRERDVTHAPPEKRGVSIVYQDHALFPHLSVRENIRYGLHFHRMERQKAKERFDHLVDLLNIASILDRVPLNLSGGEKQRVALARALIVDPKVVLLDEPLSALDPVFREEIRLALKRLQESSGATFLMVTHDFAEALSLANRGAVLNRGAIEQAGEIDDIFQRPTSTFVADFVGMKNIFQADSTGNRTRVGSVKIETEGAPGNGAGHIAIRPEDVKVLTGEAPPSGEVNAFRGKVTGILDQGFTYEVLVGVGDLTFRSLMTKKTLFRKDIREGNDVYVCFSRDAVHRF